MKTEPEITFYNLKSPTQASFDNELLPSLHSANDLAKWLEISYSELEWFSALWRHNPNLPRHLHHYHYHLSPKRNGGNRLIESPKKRLKQIQRTLNDQIIGFMPAHNAAHGFLKEKTAKLMRSLISGKNI